MILKIDDKDYSFLVERRGYKVSYKKVLGSNSCYTLDGTYHEDVLAYKALVQVPLKYMTPETLAELVESVETCVKATYFDTKENGEVTKEVIVNLSTANLVMNKGSKVYWSDSEKTGMVLTIEEK